MSTAAIENRDVTSHNTNPEPDIGPGNPEVDGEGIPGKGRGGKASIEDAWVSQSIRADCLSNCVAHMTKGAKTVQDWSLEACRARCGAIGVQGVKIAVQPKEERGILADADGNGQVGLAFRHARQGWRRVAD